jgi:hypothetical protein
MKTDFLAAAWLLGKGLVLIIQLALISLFLSHHVLLPLWEGDRFVP